MKLLNSLQYTFVIIPASHSTDPIDANKWQFCLTEKDRPTR